MVVILQKGSLSTVKLEIQPETMSVEREERNGSASFTVPATAAKVIQQANWAKLFKGPGSGIVWRVTGTDRDVITDTMNVRLGHMAQSMKDRILFDEVGPSDMGGSTDSVTCQAAIEYALSKQSDWTLGTFGFSGSGGFESNGVSIFDAFETVCNTLEDA